MKRPDRIVRYKPLSAQGVQPGQEDLMPDYLNILGMIFSMLGLMMKLKYCVSCQHNLVSRSSSNQFHYIFRPGLHCKFLPNHLMICRKVVHWIKLNKKFLSSRYCSCISFANSRVTEDAKQVLSSFMLSVSAVVMSYLQNPSPISASWS